MSHNINLTGINTRTDLAIELLENKENKTIKQIDENNIKVTTMNVTKDEEALYGKKRGNYITIEFDDITDYNNQKKVEEVLIEELNNMLNILKIDKNKSALIIGLGNEKSTPDSLGPITINNIIVTSHFFEMNINVEEGFRKVSAFNPGVTGQTGIETFDVISSIVEKIKPDFLIVIDALRASNINKLNRTIQISDSGISPGSGIGNKRKEISYETINVPVISIGVPTVVDAVTIVSDTFDYITKNYTYMNENINNPKEKLVISHKDIDKKIINKNLTHRKELFGLVGTLEDNEFKKLVNEVLVGFGYNLIVSPKEIDFIVQKLGMVLSNSINNSLHENVTHL